MDNGTLVRTMRDWVKEAGLWGTDKYLVQFEIVSRAGKDELDIRTTKPGAMIGLKGKIIDKYSYAFRTAGLSRINILEIHNFFSGKYGV